jgi:hypothetical protein
MDTRSPKLPLNVEIAVSEVTAHYRRRLRVRGWLRFGVATFALLALGTLVLAWIGNGGSPAAANTAIALFAILLSTAAWYWIVRPMSLPIPAKQIALYIDQSHPELENRIVSAIEFGQSLTEDAPREDTASLWMIERFLEETKLATGTTPLADGIESRTLQTHIGLATATLAAALAVLFAFNAFWIPRIQFAGWDRPEVTQIPFTVTPGDAEVRRGENLVALVETQHTDHQVAIAWRSRDGEWETAPMEAALGKAYHHEFRLIQEDLLYRVQVGPQRSEVFTITTWTAPRVENIHLTFNYPEYLGRPPEEMPNTGPITAVEGTRVQVEVAVNKKLAEAAVVLASGDRVPLAEQRDTVWAAEFEVVRDDQYHLEIADLNGRPSEYEPIYDISVLRDKAPEVRIAFPRGDDEVTALEEMPFTFDVSDDFGIDAYGIQYEVVGRDPIRIPMGPDVTTQESPRQTAHGERLLMLEDLALEPGDLITWTVWARDRKPGRDMYEELGDPFFLEVRPFRRSFEEAVSNAGGNQAGQQGGDQSQSTMDQKDILIATWNLRRQALDLPESEFKEKRNRIVDAQAALLQQVQEESTPQLLGGMMPLPPRQPEGDAQLSTPALRDRLIEAQQDALDALGEAELPEPGASLSEAMVQEQQAFSLLKKLEPDRQSIQQANNSRSGQGGGGGAGRREIDSLELDRTQNFYEEEQSTQQLAEQEATEQARNSLEDLTQRQQIANDEMARLISELQQARTEEEREEIKRRLERLEEELGQNLEQLDRLAGELTSGPMDRDQVAEARRGLEEARREMNRSLEDVRQERLQQARAAGARAADSLDSTQRELAGLSRAAAATRLRDFHERMDRLEERQDSVLDRLAGLAERDAERSLDDLGQQEAEQEALLNEKEDLAADVKTLLEEAGDLAQNAQQSQELMARELNDWLRETSGTGVLENMEETEPLIHYGIWEPAIEQERQVEKDLQTAAERLREIEDFLVEDEVDAMRLALEQLRTVLDDSNAGAPGTGDDQGAREDAQDAPGSDQADDNERVRTAQRGEASPAEEGTAEATSGEQGEGGQAPGNGEGQTNPSGDGRGAGSQNPRQGGRTGGYSQDNLEQFVATDYSRWLEAIQNAETLLPEQRAGAGRDDTELNRLRLARAREAIGEMRRDYRGRGASPQFEGFLDQVVMPLTETAADLDLRIQALLQEKEFALVGETDVPAQYKGRVAEYFRILSEAETSP